MNEVSEDELLAAHKAGSDCGIATAHAMAVVVASELYDADGRKTPEAQVALNVALRIARLRNPEAEEAEALATSLAHENRPVSSTADFLRDYDPDF